MQALTKKDGGADAPQQKSRLKITHAQNDARYIALGRTLVLAKSPDWEDELARANKKKNGSPFVYAESMFFSLAAIRSFCKLSFRVLEGVAVASIGRDAAPGYRQIHRRINKINVSIKDNIISARGKKGILNMAIDGTGLSPNARSEYIRYRHKVKHGFIRIVMAVDTDTREILSFSATDETVGEAPQFEDLVSEAMQNTGVKPVAEPTGSHENAAHKDMQGEPEIIMRADGGFDSREIFEYCKQHKIKPRIRVRHNATTRSRGISRDRGTAALDQLGGGITDPAEFARLTKDEREANRKEWKKRVQYGKRWLVEIVISSFKRLFGDSVAARRWKNIIQEINLKVNIYNNMLRIQRKAIAATQ